MNVRLLAGRLRDAWLAYPEVRRRYAAVPEGWKSQLAGNDMQQVRDIWKAFGLPMYQDDADWQTGDPVPEIGA